MIPGSILLVGWSLALAQSSSAPQQQPPCAQVLAGAVTDSAVSEICAGDDAARLAAAAPKDSAVRTRQLEAAAVHYRRAATVASMPKTKLLALTVLAGAYDAQHLDDPRQMESVLRQIIALTPEDLAPVFRLAKVQEDEGLIVPHFPPQAQAAGVKGVVVTEVVIDTSGNVTDARVVQSIPLLDDEALRVVRNWHFAPTMLNGQPVPVRMNLSVNFSLPPRPAPPTPPR
jgi:TonB family protein